MQGSKEGWRRWARKFAGKSVAQIKEVFGEWVNLPENFGNPERLRLFPPSMTFWLFLSQVLDQGRSCKEIVRAFLAGLFLETKKTASPNTAAYCSARAKLSFRELAQTNRRVVDKIERETATWLWCGRRVRVVDGSGLSMPDTPKNQAEWPQAKKAKPGCSFPVMRIVTLFSLANGAMIDLAHGPLVVHERELFRRLWHWLEKGDVLLADRGFCGFADFLRLSLQGVDCVMRKHARRKNASILKRINKNDRIVEWRKSRVGPKWLDAETWMNMPESIAVREVEVHVANPGFRTKTILVATTLLDYRSFSEADIAALYLRRWKVELFLRDIKTTMGMDILRCKTPRMVEKELWMYVIAYNLICGIRMEAALTHKVKCERISFKATVSSIRQWAPLMAQPHLSPKVRLDLYSAMLYYLAKDLLPQRPGRCEPRARKRRPKNYQLLNKPRGEFKEIFHRNRYKKA